MLPAVKIKKNDNITTYYVLQLCCK